MENTTRKNRRKRKTRDITPETPEEPRLDADPEKEIKSTDDKTSELPDTALSALEPIDEPDTITRLKDSAFENPNLADVTEKSAKESAEEQSTRDRYCITHPTWMSP